MNKKVNTVIFILCATAFNIIIAVLCLFAFLFLYSGFIMHLLPETGQSWGFMIIFLLAVAVSFIAYRFALKIFMSKVELDKYFDPIFASKYKKK